MYRTMNFHLSPSLSAKSLGNLNPESLHLQGKDPDLNHSIARLIRENETLSQSLQAERQKNFNLVEVKRKMEDDIQRLEFELDRISNYQELGNKQIQIKKYQLTQQNSKLQAQLDQYFEENKKIRAQVRKLMTQCEVLTTQKQDLTNQNVSLKNHILELEKKLSQQRQLGHKPNRNEGQIQQPPSIHQMMTIRSIDDPRSHPSIKQQSSGLIPESPSGHLISLKNINADYFYKRQQMSTNPSLHKQSPYSPLAHPKGQGYSPQENAEPSPRSFQNKKILEKLELMSPCSSNNQNRVNLTLQMLDQKSPSVLSYANRQSPVMHPPRLNLNSNQELSIRGVWEGEQKKQLKDEVSKIRNEIVDGLIDRYYKSALEQAEKEKSNSLKLFICSLAPKVPTLNHMVMNYLEAREMLAQSCPTFRLKWDPTNPLSCEASGKPGTRSQIMLKNTTNIGQVYERIKENRRKEKSVAGEYLALFRLLTVLNKMDQEMDPLLKDSIKHSALKQIQRIHSWAIEPK